MERSFVTGFAGKGMKRIAVQRYRKRGLLLSAYGSVEGPTAPVVITDMPEQIMMFLLDRVPSDSRQQTPPDTFAPAVRGNEEILHVAAPGTRFGIEVTHDQGIADERAIVIGDDRFVDGLLLETELIDTAGIDAAGTAFLDIEVADHGG
jgi:hypothetical protein